MILWFIEKLMIKLISDLKVYKLLNHIKFLLNSKHIIKNHIYKSINLKYLVKI